LPPDLVHGRHGTSISAGAVHSTLLTLTTYCNFAMCNPIHVFSVLSTRPAKRATALLVILLGAVGLELAGASSSVKSLERAESALKRLQAGDHRSAAELAKQAIEGDPGEPLFHNLAATILLLTGDAAGAQSEWLNAIADMPDDGLARFGLGLSLLSRGETARAMDQFQLAEESGDRAHCILAQRYVEALRGAVGSGAGLALPEAFTATTLTLNGLSYAKSGDHKRALIEIKAAMASLPGDPFAEPPGPVMTFDPKKPLKFTARRLPMEHGLAGSRRASEKPYFGTVTLSAASLGTNIGFVAFKIDGNFSSVANTPPFQLIWDTTRFPNGMHKIEITVYDKEGRQTNSATREVRTANLTAPIRDQADASRMDAVRSGLWQALTLRPSRAVLNYAAAQSAAALGDSSSASRFIQQTAAIDPTYRDARARLAVLDGGLADLAVWRGSSERPWVALTFDDGPKPGITEQLLAVLTKERVPATFFVIGRDVTAHPDLAKKIVESGMQIENHSYTHPNLTLLSLPSIEAELLRTLASVRSATGKRVRYFRPPGGNVNEEVSRVAARLGLTPCMWTLNGEALENGSPERLIEYIVSRTTAGAIVLLHNGRMTTVEALPRIIEGLRKRGFEFATLDQITPQRAVRSRPATVVPAAVN